MDHDPIKDSFEAYYSYFRLDFVLALILNLSNEDIQLLFKELLIVHGHESKTLQSQAFHFEILVAYVIFNQFTIGLKYVSVSSS